MVTLLVVLGALASILGALASMLLIGPLPGAVMLGAALFGATEACHPPEPGLAEASRAPPG